MDNLDMDLQRARAVGMKYADWKVLHPHTKEENERAIAAMGETPKKKLSTLSKCHLCGAEFQRRNGNQLYCGPKCRRIASQKKLDEAFRKHLAIASVSRSECKWCGKTFCDMGDTRRRYCSPGCKDAAVRDQQKGYRNNRRERNA